MSDRFKRYVREEAQEAKVPVRCVLERNNRQKAVARARHRIASRLHQDGFTLGQIGQWMGRHHTTILYYLRENLE